MKLALIQMQINPGAVEANLARAEKLTREAAKRGADTILLPEALPFGWMDPSAQNAAGEIPNGRHCARFGALAAHLQIHLCTGLVERSGEKVFNGAVLFSPEGKVLLHHRKIHELGIAHNCYSLGDRLGVVDTKLGRVGLIICADGFAPGQVITRTLALMGAQLILSPCAWAVPPDHNNVATPYGKLWIDNYSAVAREFGIWVAGCSNVGPIQSGAWAGHKCIGCSLVIGPDGEVKSRGSYGESAEAIILVDVSLPARSRCDAGNA